MMWTVGVIDAKYYGDIRWYHARCMDESGESGKPGRVCGQWTSGSQLTDEWERLVPGGGCWPLALIILGSGRGIPWEEFGDWLINPKFSASVTVMM